MRIDLPVPLKSAAIRGLLALPRPALRAFAGKPVVIDGNTLDLEAQAVLRMLALTREPEFGMGPIDEARANTIANSRAVGGAQPIGSVRDLEVAGVPARLYVPRAGSEALLVYIHGGGWIVGDIDSHDSTCRVLAEKAGVRVLSLDYRLAPEHPFPAAYEDCMAAYRWVAAHAADLGADPARLAVGGDSAGGNLSAAVALQAAEEGLPLAFQLLIYPATDPRAGTESHRLFREGFFLTGNLMDRATASYAPTPEKLADPRYAVIDAEVPAGLAPAYVCTAGFDPLRDEGEAYAEKLMAAGVEVEYECFTGQIHGFANWTGAGRSGPAAVARLAEVLKAGLAR
ncbi:alpha/beta hydrolase [Nocardioides jiangxiensis]|uniref:Alpha/beta hydrolase n=1 Tax=Nocardioides jiangxiensis TaxID=3064524 RepID=A0ABT9AZ58_9ACTN|nr:alpha/beta hydrolase [Nocardioides sp. WY-20]MDO7867875.1 alpha/beta hydrolase [Nocardioides sp. WY-20]